MKTVEWDNESNQLQLIDQRLLPGEFRINNYDRYETVAQAISQMVVRGAPAIGVTAAFGYTLAAFQSSATSKQELMEDLEYAANILQAARPTAVNLVWALNRLKRTACESRGDVDELRRQIHAAARGMADEDIQINRSMALNGSSLIDDGDTIIHHCNTGALAAVDWGTALGAIRMAHEQGKRIHVLVDETRPRLQGSRLTAWELEQYGIPYDIITDNSAGYHLRQGNAQKVFFGADRVAANGDVANKIGTYMLALAAFDNHVPAYCVVPRSTIDLDTPAGDKIPIEERPQDEVLDIRLSGQLTHPPGATARNPAFDVTPNRLITAIVTEHGVIYPPYALDSGDIR